MLYQIIEPPADEETGTEGGWRVLEQPEHMGRSEMTKLIELCASVYAKELPAQALLRLRPGLRNQPCVVMQGEAPLQSVCSLNAKARVSGAMHDMTAIEVETLPAMNMLSRSNKKESAAKAALLGIAGTFSPRVEGHSSEIAFECVIDIAGTKKLFGTADQLGRE